MNTTEEIAVQEANILYHTRMAETYDSDSPHFRMENQERVSAILRSISAKTGRGSLLDLGAGTGFVCTLAARHFDRVTGVDLTPAMIHRLPAQVGAFRVLGDLSRLPFSNDRFDVCTCYGTLHHLFDPRGAVREALRCLRTGGYFYSDSDPNAPFFTAVYGLSPSDSHSPIIQREIQYTAQEAETTAARYGMDIETVRKSEYQKITKPGFTREELQNMFSDTGFREVQVDYEWFMGEAVIHHGASAEHARLFADHLRQCLPVTTPLFKYLRVIARK